MAYKLLELTNMGLYWDTSASLYSGKAQAELTVREREREIFSTLPVGLSQIPSFMILYLHTFTTSQFPPTYSNSWFCMQSEIYIESLYIYLFIFYTVKPTQN